ncbi:MAG: GGDEF domain-containing protein [Clostridiales bacterium]|nr:GGDEF domain-containing protein [Clostridiales bacterium]
MGSMINLQAVYVTDLVGVAILMTILASRGWNLPARKEESRIIATLLVVSIFNCIADIYAFACDGMAGPLYYWILMVSNTFLYLYNLIVGIGIIYLIIRHIDRQAKGWHIIIFWSLIIIEVSLLIINFFTPVVFGIDENNAYYRGTYYLLFVLVGFALILYGYGFYIINKLKNPSLRYFPVIGFLLPILIGNTVQMQIYGISLLPISFTVAFAAITISLQNECIYIDKLTGVYNRYELDKILKKRVQRKNVKIAALMLDLNDFKAINDNYSHEEGDEALVAFATILADTIRSEGVVVRFAGDEFIILMPKFTEINIDDYSARIQSELDKYNEASGKPYKLSAAIGGKVFDPHKDNMDNVLKDIDKLMYTAKREYYIKHDRRHNRS